MSKEIKFRINSNESLSVERDFYEYESDKALVSILAREFANNQNSDVKNMLSEYCTKCKKSFEKLALTQNMVIDEYIDRTKYKNINFVFDFKNEEVKFTID